MDFRCNLPLTRNFGPSTAMRVAPVGAQIIIARTDIVNISVAYLRSSAAGFTDLLTSSKAHPPIAA